MNWCIVDLRIPDPIQAVLSLNFTGGNAANVLKVWVAYYTATV